MLHKKVYDDSFILHDETLDDPLEKDAVEQMKAEFGSQVCARALSAYSIKHAP